MKFVTFCRGGCPHPPGMLALYTTADHGDQKGEVNMATPNTGELLVQQAQEAERLRLLILADECKTIEEFREKLREQLNK